MHRLWHRSASAPRHVDTAFLRELVEVGPLERDDTAAEAAERELAVRTELVDRADAAPDVLSRLPES